MKRMELLRRLARDNGKKMILLVMDGIGGLPGPDGKTELEAARTPNLDALAEKSELGLLDMVDPGITRKRPGHLSLFVRSSRVLHRQGILEAMGVGALCPGTSAPGEISAPAPKTTIILDRRAADSHGKKRSRGGEAGGSHKRDRWCEGHLLPRKGTPVCRRLLWCRPD